MYKSKMTSKGQLTVPKEIRDMLELSAGNEVVFKVEGDIVLFEKKYENVDVDCPVCKGSGEFNINNQACFFCDRSGQINAADSIWKLLANIMSTSLKYGISVSVIDHELGDGHQIHRRVFPKITLGNRSNQYSDQLLDIAQDYLQMKIIEDEAPRSLQNPELFMQPIDSELNEILDLLKSDESKNQVTEWFRGERNVYPIKSK